MAVSQNHNWHSEPISFHAYLTCIYSALTRGVRPPVRDPFLLIPLLIGIPSLLGIGIIFVSVWIPMQATPISPPQTATPFKYLLLATETVSPTLEPETAIPFALLSDLVLSSEDGEESILPITDQGGILEIPPSLSLTGQAEKTGNTTTQTLIPTPTITPAPIFANALPMTAGIYDGAVSQIVRSGSWANRDSADAYQGTLLISNTAGNHLAFSFVGRQMILAYQDNDNAGNLTVNIDGSELSITQRVGNSWFSEELEPMKHFVLITHQDGTSVNLDYVEILD